MDKLRGNAVLASAPCPFCTAVDREEVRGTADYRCLNCGATARWGLWVDLPRPTDSRELVALEDVLEALQAALDSEISAPRRAAILHCRRLIRALPRHNGEVERLREAEAIVAEQAGSDGLWFIPETAVEAFFQQELRRLHAAVEGKSPDEFTRAHLARKEQP